MKFFIGLLMVTALLIPFFSVNAQEEIITLNTEELGTHQRPLVNFTHQQHADQIDCARCHHDYDQFGANQGGDEGQRCSECHTPEKGDNPINLVNAFHRQCKDCHQKLNRAAGNTERPEMCGQCHLQTVK